MPACESRMPAVDRGPQLLLDRSCCPAPTPSLLAMALLQEHECLIDFIAVSPDARGKGVGALLMRWAEQTGAAILAETEADAVAANGVDMTLWVSRARAQGHVGCDVPLALPAVLKAATLECLTESC